MTDPFTVAVVQRPPVLLDRSATLKQAVEHRHEIDRAPRNPVSFGAAS